MVEHPSVTTFDELLVGVRDACIDNLVRPAIVTRSSWTPKSAEIRGVRGIRHPLRVYRHDQTWSSPRCRSRFPLGASRVRACDMLADFLRARRGDSGASALVRMPTGTGKSGVIAVSAQHLLPRGDALLLTPWDALVKQLREDVANRFWKRIDVPAPTAKAVHRLYPSTADDSLSRAQRSTIWVATIATLQRLHAEGSAAYEELRRRLRFVVVDEGHYEPARSWSRAVAIWQAYGTLYSDTLSERREVLRVRRRVQSHFSHADAQREHLVRTVAFQPLAFDDPAEFCAKLVRTVDSTLGSDPARRVIVRCGTFAEINQIVTELRTANQSVLGVHERYSGKGDSTHLTHVPPLETRPERYWVHQYKLTEGLDSAEFRAVAYFSPFPASGLLFQQVGRVLRNPSRSSTETAVVIHHHADDLDQSWEAYRAYDRGAQHRLPLSPLEAAATQPPPQYFGRRFRSSFDIRGDVSLTDLRFPRSVRVLEVGPTFAFDELAEKVEDYLDEKDCLHERVLSPREDIRLHPYMRIMNSPILFRAAFYQSTLGYTFYRRINDYLLYLDTEGLYPDALDRLATADSAALRRLYSGRNVRLGSISLSNTNIGPMSARRRTLHARSLADLAPDLSDHAQIATTVTGSYEVSVSVDEVRYVSRYVGFSRARVSDRGFVSF